MIESGDSVREIGSNEILKTFNYNGLTDEFQVQRIPVRFVKRANLELVEKAPGNAALSGPRAIPERWPID
jgi:dihydrofolate reductase